MHSDIDEVFPNTPQNASAPKGRSLFIAKVVVLLIISSVIALILGSGLVKIPFGIGFSKKAVVLEDGDIPCLPSEETSAVSPKDVTVSVLNSTQKSGLATKVSKDLKEAGFNVQTVGNATNTYKAVAKIQTPMDQVVKAYTLAVYIPGATIEVNSNLKDSLNLIIGVKFEKLQNADHAKKILEEPLQNLKKCVR